MATEIITTEDLQHFRTQLLDDLKDLICQLKKENHGAAMEGFKTKQVRKILGCSNGKLQSLRIDSRISPIYISLFMAIVQHWNENNCKSPICVFSKDLMALIRKTTL